MRIDLSLKRLYAFFLFVFGFLTLTIPVYAQCATDEVTTDLGCLPTDPVGFVQKFYAWGLGLIAFVAVLFMIIGGYYIMTSRGNPELVVRGKSFIFYSIAGVLLAVLGFVFIEIVTGVLQIPGFS